MKYMLSAKDLYPAKVQIYEAKSYLLMKLIAAENTFRVWLIFAAYFCS